VEENIDFEKILETIKLSPVEYQATYDPETGSVISVGPSFAFKDKKHKLNIDQETAELIIEGKIQIQNCFVDITGTTLQIAETKSMFKIDDVLHRVSNTEWSVLKEADIYISYNRKRKELIFQLSANYGGTKKFAGTNTIKNKRRVVWSGDTNMNFFITEYNDPNIFYKLISFTVSELEGKRKIFKNIELPKRFSIYTKRIFQNYILEDA
jgi:hypothetical protein